MNFRMTTLLCAGMVLMGVHGWAQQPVLGTLAGGLYDAANGQPIRQANVSVQGPETKETLTDIDGRYRVQLKPGNYKVIFKTPTHLPAVIETVTILAGEVADGSTVAALAKSVTVVEVKESVGGTIATAETVVLERKLAAAVTDAMSSQEMARSGASDAAQALEKVPGVSVVGDQFVYVRGLGERYSATTLNNALLPTTEFEKKVVPLDLFPALLLDQVKVQKTYMPDLPGEFSAGLVQIETVQFPTRKILEVSMKIGFNDRTTGKRFLRDTAGGRNWTGFDDGSRALPSIIPSDKRLLRGNYTQEELQSFGRSFANNWIPDSSGTAMPNQTYSVVAGNTYGKWGLIGALTYSKGLLFLDEDRNFYRTGRGAGDRPFLFNSYDYDSYNNNVRLGAVFNAAYKINDTNKLIFKNFVNRDTDNETRQFEGYNSDFESNLRNTRNRWVERGLLSHQVEGDHMLMKLGGLILNWQMSYSKADRNEPDLREYLYRELDPGSGEYFLTTDSQSAFRMFNGLKDNIYNPQVSIRKPMFLGPVSGLWKIGFSFTHRNRDFNSRRFRYFPINLAGIDTRKPIDQILAPENIRPGAYELREDTRSTDSYLADQNIYAGYAMADLSLTPRLRLAGGVRFENSRQEVTTFDAFTSTVTPVNALLDNTDPLPAVNLIYSLTQRQNLRFGYSRTVSRPDFRELSPFDFTDVTGGRAVIGNANLRRALIENYDARWEWFPGGEQLVAASFFWKNFDDPIEQIVQPTNALRTSFANALGARNRGLEFELRKGLGFIHPEFRRFILMGNCTFVASEIDLARQGNIATSLTRPLAGQSRHIWNAALDWAEPRLRSTARLQANSVSRRITDAGTLGLPDIYEERNVIVDFHYTWNVLESGKLSFKFSAENLNDNRYRFTQAGLPFRVYSPGRVFSVGATYVVF